MLFEHCCLLLAFGILGRSGSRGDGSQGEGGCSAAEGQEATHGGPPQGHIHTRIVAKSYTHIQRDTPGESFLSSGAGCCSGCFRGTRRHTCICEVHIYAGHMSGEQSLRRCEHAFSTEPRLRHRQPNCRRRRTPTAILSAHAQDRNPLRSSSLVCE